MKNKIILFALLITASIFALEFNAIAKDEMVELQIEPSEISINAATHIIVYDADKFDVSEQTFVSTANAKIVDNPGRLAIYAEDNSSFTVFLSKKNDISNAVFELRTYISHDVSGGMPNPNIDFEQKTLTLKVQMDSDDIDIAENISIAAYPNPFKDRVEIEIYLPKSEKIKLSIFDILGKDVASLSEGFLEKGTHSFVWNGNSFRGNDLSQGLYFCRIDGEEITEVKQLYLMD